MASTKNMEFQQNLVDKLKADPSNYEDAAIYTVLLHLVQGNGIDHVQEMLLEVANDLDKGIRIEFYNKPKKK